MISGFENWAMAQANLPPVVLAAPVVPRSQSPSSAAQRETARLATMVATLAQLKLMLGVNARPTPPRAPQSDVERVRENKLEDLGRLPQAISPQVVITPGARASTAAELTSDWAESNRMRAAASTMLAKAIEAVPEKTAVKVVEKIEEHKGEPKK